MKVRITQALVSVAFLFSFASAQQPAQPAAVPAAGTAADAQATVYVYRYKQFVGSALSPSVYCDETELARMDNGRFFVAKLAPGKHAFRSNDKQAGVEVELKPGEEYYIRVELATGMMKGHGRLVVATPEQGSYEIKKLKPLDQDRVKDTQHVAAVSPEAK